MIERTPEQIDMVRLIALKGALRMKVEHGIIAARGVSLLDVAREFGFTGRTNKAALAFVDTLLADREGGE